MNDAACDQSSFPAKMSYAPSGACESELDSLRWSSYYPLISYPQVSWVKQCFIEEPCAQPFFVLVLVGLVMFFNSMNLGLTNGGRHFGSRFLGLLGAKRCIFYPTVLLFPTPVFQVQLHEVRCYWFFHSNSSKPSGGYPRSSYSVRCSLSQSVC